MSNSMEFYTEIGQRLVDKWSGLVESIENPTIKVNTAILLENEAQKGGILVEDTQSGQTGGADTRTGSDVYGGTQGAGDDIAPFQHYLLPLVRRVYPNLIANELVGVQPMTSPASLVFYLKYRYSGLVNITATGAGSALEDTAVAKGSTAAGTEYGNFAGNTWNIDPYYSLQKIQHEAIPQGVVDPDDGSISSTVFRTVKAVKLLTSLRSVHSESALDSL